MRIVAADARRQGRVVASGRVCATFLGADGPVSPDEILEEIGQSATMPGEPGIVAKLRELQALINESQGAGPRSCRD